MRHRFGDSEETTIARVINRKQRKDETVQAHADDMQMLLGQSVLPETMKRNLLMNNLRPALRDQAIHSIPLTLEDVIKNATFLEEQALGISGEKIKQWEQQHARNQDPVERMTRAMDKMSISVANALNRTDQRPAHRPNISDRNRQGRRDGNTPPMHCWKCLQFGHKAADCRVNPNSAQVINYVESYGIEQDSYGDNIPSTPEAFAYMPLEVRLAHCKGPLGTGHLGLRKVSRLPVRTVVIQQPVAVVLDPSKQDPPGLDPQLGPQSDPRQPLQNPQFLLGIAEDVESLTLLRN